MIRSMTGFGDVQVTTDEFSLRVEVRSVNNRSLRVTFRLPDRLQGLEAVFEKRVRDFATRGTVSVAVTLEDHSRQHAYSLDEDVIAYYREALQSLGSQLDADGNVPLSVLVTLPGAIRKSQNGDEIPETLRQAVEDAFTSALQALTASREKEGEALWQDMAARCDQIARLLDKVEVRVPKMLEDYRQRLSDRLVKLLEGVGSSLPAEELCRQVALFAERSDISEEISRMRSHLQLMRESVNAPEECGRRLSFISQEMFREANTMGSKSNDADLIAEILDIKAEIERIREQGANVE